MKSKILSTFIVTVTLLNPTLLIANQDENDYFDYALSDLLQINIISSSLFESTVLESPSTVSVVLESDWRRQGARRNTDAFNHLPSILTSDTVFSGEVPFIRGYARQGVIGVLGTLDGVPLSDFIAGSVYQRTPTFNLGILDSIEVVRGPGSALYGSDAFQGVVAMNTFKAIEDMALARGSLASDGYYEAVGRYSVAVRDSDRLSLAVAVNGQPDQNLHYGFNHPVSNEHLRGKRGYEYDAGSLSLKYISHPTDTAELSYQLFIHDYHANAFTGFGTLPSSNRDLSGIEADFYLGQINYNQSISDNQRIAVDAYYWLLDEVNDRIFKIPSGDLSILAFGKQYRTGIKAEYRHRLTSHTDLAWVLGTEKMGVDSAKNVVFSPAGIQVADTEQAFAGEDRDIHSLTVEGRSRWSNDKWQLTYGGRVDIYSDIENHESPRLGLFYFIDTDTVIKLLYGHAFRAPVAVELLGAVGAIEANPDIKPETLDSYEFVLQKKSKNSYFNFVIYRNYWKDGIQNFLRSDASSGPPFQAKNFSKNNAKGLEIEYKIDYNQWQIDLNGSYVRSEAADVGEYAMFPKWIINVGLGYYLSNLQTQLFLYHRYHSKVEDTPRGSVVQAGILPHYSRVDLSAIKKVTSNMDISFIIRNLFDRDNFVPSTSSTRGGIPKESFSINAGVEYTF